VRTHPPPRVNKKTRKGDYNSMDYTIGYYNIADYNQLLQFASMYSTVAFKITFDWRLDASFAWFSL